MPTYQYACTDPECGNRFELVQAFTDPAVTSCPLCASRVRKVYGSVGVVFKGSGFYRNDSRAESGNGKSGSGEPAGRSPKDGKDSSGSGPGTDSSSTSSAKESASASTAGSPGSSSSAPSSSNSSSGSSSGPSSGKAAASA